MSREIGRIDPTLRIVTSLNQNDLVFHDVRKDPFKVYGLYQYRKEPIFKRMADVVPKSVSNRLVDLNYNTAGGRVRFSTNSSYVAIKVEMPNVTSFTHMTLTGSAGFDLYIDSGGESTYYGTIEPPKDIKNGYEGILRFEDSSERNITINFPLYSDISVLEIGLQESACLKSGAEYRYKVPVVYYGSSITQGGCASRPGNSYSAMLSRIFDCDYTNLGFSGNARGERVVADYISQLSMSVFVYDYDHNAPDSSCLCSTHERFFQRIRKGNKELPIILMSKPDINTNNTEDLERRNIIFKTYDNAKNRGDDNVYFIDGESLFAGENRDACTVDGCHPNDLGFWRMTQTIASVLGKLL